MVEKPWQIRDRRIGGNVGTPEDKVSVEDFPYAINLDLGGFVMLLHACDADSAEILGRLVCTKMNTTPDDIARAVKASLVETCGKRSAQNWNPGHIFRTYCSTTSVVCETNAKSETVDPLQCPLVRRVLDALGMSAELPKSGENQP